MSRLSLRARLLIIGMALLTAGVLTTNAVAVSYLHQHLVDRVDGHLRLLSAVFSRLPVPANRDSQIPGGATSGLDLISDLHIVQLSPAGESTATLRSAGTDGGPRLPRLDAAAVAAHRQQPFEVSGWRVLAVPRADGSGSIVVAAALDEVDQTIGNMWTVCATTIAAVLAVLAAVGWFAVRAGLRPLRRIEETAAAIAGGNLAHRVPDLAPPRTEVGRLSAALNGMLAQIEAAFAFRAESENRMRRFLGDVSHELRTPLFGIKGFTELYRMGGLPERADVDRTMAHIERESTRLASLAEDLLLLARLEEPHAVVQPTPMDLRTLAADAHLDLRALDPSRPIQLTGPDGGPPATAPVLGDESRLRQVVTNLVGNAVAHTPAGTPVRIGVGTVDGTAVLELADEGPGLTEEQAVRVFDRFYRASSSRSREDAVGGAGLGLAIAQSLVFAHGGRIELRTAPGAGATFRIELPRLTE